MSTRLYYIPLLGKIYSLVIPFVIIICLLASYNWVVFVDTFFVAPLSKGLRYYTMATMHHV